MRPFTKSIHVLLFVAGMTIQGFPQTAPAPQPAEQTPAQTEQSQGQPPDAEKKPDVVESEVTVTARRVEEEAQDVPIPFMVVDGKQVENAGAFNVNRLKELVPTVQFFSVQSS